MSGEGREDWLGRGHLLGRGHEDPLRAEDEEEGGDPEGYFGGRDPKGY